MTEPTKGFSKEYLKRLREIDKRADAIAAPSVAHAAKHWDETPQEIDDMVERGFAIDLGQYTSHHDQG